MSFSGVFDNGTSMPFIGCTNRSMSVVRSEFSTTCTFENGTASESLSGIWVFEVSNIPICWNATWIASASLPIFCLSTCAEEYSTTKNANSSVMKSAYDNTAIKDINTQFQVTGNTVAGPLNGDGSLRDAQGSLLGA